MKKILEWVLPFLFCAVFIYGRFIGYGRMNDSVAVQDTESYFAAARMNPASINFFSQPRSAAYPLLIMLSNPTGEYELTHMSEPYFGTESRLAVQPGTENLTRNQTILSIICWIAATVLIVSSVNGWFAKAVMAFLILAFGFVPQVADWDSVLSSESMSISLFVLMLGLTMKVLPDGKDDHLGSWLAAVMLVIVTALWLFTRDTNAYFVIAEALILIISAVVMWAARKGQRVSALICGFLLAGLFAFQQITFRQSDRWMIPLLNNLTSNVFPYEERVEFFADHEMPTDEEIITLSGSAEYNELYKNEKFTRWAKLYGLDTYQRFLLSMPLWSLLQVYENLDTFFEENLQPFFYGSDQEKPHWADKPGNLLHPLSAAVILIDFLLLILLGIKAVRSGDAADIRSFLLLILVFFGGGLLMSISYLGEVRSIWRHVLGGVMALRLMLWLGIGALFSGRSEEGFSE